MKVQVAHVLLASVEEAVSDHWRDASEGSGRNGYRLVIDPQPDGELAVYVVQIGVLVMDVQIRAVPLRTEVEGPG